MKKILAFLKNLILITLPTLVILFIILELFFRYGIPASDPPETLFDEQENITCFSQRKTSGHFSIGKFAQIRTRWHINNMGWNYPIDYSSRTDKKLITIIGDSFIESFQVDVGKNYPYLLREKLLPEYEVYAFGISGASLSQYLQLSRYVNRHFNPDILIFNMVHNDYHESVYQLESRKTYFLKLLYNEETDSFSETVPKPNYGSSQYKPWKRILYGSAIYRYLYKDLNASAVLHTSLKEKKVNRYEANVNPNEIKKHKEMIRKATEYLVKTIKEENSNKRIIYILDAPREAIYNNSLDSSQVIWMNEMMREMCTKNAVECIDLTGPMHDDYLKNHKKFNSDLDNHWNEYGHEFVANIIYEYLNKQQ